MKKIVKSFLMLAAFAVVFSGCEDDVIQSELTLDMENTGSVEIALEARLDLSANDPWVSIPDGVKVRLSIENSEFNPNATSGRWTHDAVTADGKVTVTGIPTTNDGVELKIKAEDFIAEQTQPKDNPAVSLETRFSVPEQTIDIFPDHLHYTFIQYPVWEEETIEVELEMVERKVELTAYFSQVDIDNQDPSFLGWREIRFYNDNWEDFVFQNWGAEELIEVPKGQGFTMEFQGIFINADSDPIQTRYHVSRGAYNEDSPFVSVAEEIRFERQTL